MSKQKNEPKERLVKKVCPECQTPYKSNAKRCQSCGSELMDKCPSCDEPFEGILLGKKVKFCTSCGNPFPPEEPLEIVIKPPGPDSREEIRIRIGGENAEPSVEDMRALLLAKSRAGKQQRERIEAERKEFEKLKAQGKIDF